MPPCPLSEEFKETLIMTNSPYKNQYSGSQTVGGNKNKLLKIHTSLGAVELPTF